MEEEFDEIKRKVEKFCEKYNCMLNIETRELITIKGERKVYCEIESKTSSNSLTKWLEMLSKNKNMNFEIKFDDNRINS